MINTLLTWRFIFTILVFYAHLGLTGNDSPIYTWIYPYLVTEAGMGIVFFFILSGFILSYSYQQKLLNRNESYIGFISRRVARLFPLHLFTLLLIIPMSVYSQIKTGGGFAKWFLKLFSNATLTQSWIPSSDFYFSLNGPSWCMSDEMFFYLIFPLIIYYGVKLPMKYRILLPVLFTAVIVYLMTVTDRAIHHYLFYINPLTRVMEFILGIQLFQVYKYLKAGHLKFLNYTVLEICAIITLFAFLLLSSNVAPVFRFSVYYWIPVFLLILAFSFQKGRISAFMAKPAISQFGKLSFGFYLFHGLVIKYGLAINDRLHITGNGYLLVAILFLLSVLASFLGYYLIERPSYTFLKGLITSVQSKRYRIREQKLRLETT